MPTNQTKKPYCFLLIALLYMVLVARAFYLAGQQNGRARMAEAIKNNFDQMDRLMDENAELRKADRVAYRQVVDLMSAVYMNSIARTLHE